jgi:hypothetical protein
MSTQSHDQTNHAQRERERSAPTAERPKTASADSEATRLARTEARRDQPERAAAVAPTAATAAPAAAREDADPKSFQRNALQARLSADDRDRISARLG